VVVSSEALRQPASGGTEDFVDWVGLLAVAARDCPACGFDAWDCARGGRLAGRLLSGLRGLEVKFDLLRVREGPLDEVGAGLRLLQGLDHAVDRLLRELRVLQGGDVLEQLLAGSMLPASSLIRSRTGP
jgi:hypothetical protein